MITKSILKLAKNSSKGKCLVRFNFSKEEKVLENEKALQDWQYCKLITQELNHHNINKAFSYLFSSHFNNVILDMQIYHQIHEKLNQKAMPMSYAEILYLFYREHFPPNQLNKSWLHKLTYSKNTQLIEKLKQDYQQLNQLFPNRNLDKNAKKNKNDKDQNLQQILQQNKPQSIIIHGEKEPLIKKIDSLELTPKDFQRINYDLNLENNQPNIKEYIKMRLALHVKTLLEQVFLQSHSFTKIILKDIQIQFKDDALINNHDDDAMMEDQHEQEVQQDDGMDMSSMPFQWLVFGIKNIKFGHIQFCNKQSKYP